MSLNAFAAAWQIDPGSPETDGHRAAKATRKLVLLCLADRVNRDTGYAFPSVASICEDTGLGESAVKYALRALVETGIIIHDGWAGRADRKTKRYRMAFIALVVDNPFTPTVKRNHGGHVVTDGGHVVTSRGSRRGPEPVIEPVKNRARRKDAVDNHTRPAVPSPEETLAMLDQEHTR